MPRVGRRKHGAVLAELLVALALSVAVAAAAAVALTGAERYARVTTGERDDRRVLRDVERILRAELYPATADSMRILGDTAVEFLGVIGTSVACAVGGASLVLPPDEVLSGIPLSSWRSAPDAGDVVVAWDSSGGGGWQSALIDSVETRTDGAGCVPSSGLLSGVDSAARTRVLRVLASRAWGPGVTVGAVVRIERRGRYALVRGTDRSWSLAYRRCITVSACGASQPVVGPLASPADSGLVVTRTGASYLRVFARTPLRRDRSSRPSVSFALSLRNGGGPTR